MKITMKTLLAVSVCTLLLAACTSKNNQPIDNSAAIEVYATIDGVSQKLVNNQQIIIDKFTQDEYVGVQFLFEGKIHNPANEALDYGVTAVRAYDLTKAGEEFCLASCIPSNGQQTQNFSTVLAPESDQAFYAHLTPEGMQYGDYQVTYTFHTSDNSQHLSVTVIYRYKAD